MRIKTLSIHGFKSFIDNVHLNFSTGVSGIVGPNGCGKSNIVDAIRWVIGEQNPRHLRGKLMEDIIFNGSESRKPLGMAEVSLVFSNHEGKAPLRFANFTEIEVARRLYRSGESEYYLNKVQCRLRDIVDLFTDTGIGTHAYSIVEQGQVGWIVNAKPEDRRVIFEEAAGISKFKHKKDAALRKLESTRENLTRVNDIISEVRRQLNSLNRQAKKAERYKVLRDELKEVDLRIASIEFKKIGEEIGAFSKRLAELVDEEAALTARSSGAESSAEEFRLECADLEAAFMDISERLVGIERLIQEEEHAGALAEARLAEHKRNGERLAFEIGEIRDNIQGANRQMESLSASLIEAEAIISTEAARVKEEAGRLGELNGQIRLLEEQEGSEKAESLRALTTLSDVRHALQTVMKEAETARHKEEKARIEKEGFEKELLALEDRALSLRQSLNARLGARGVAEAELIAVKERLGSLEHESRAAEARLKAFNDDYAGACARMSALEDMEKNLESVKEGPRAIMFKENRTGVHGLVADCIETGQRYERAVQAALGDRLQYVIVESQRQGADAVEYLKKNLSGRGTFVPVRELRPQPAPVPANAAYGVPDNAKELLNEVRIKDPYHALVSALLSDVLVVEDMKTALEIWQRNGLYNKTLVTLEGDVIDPQGIITGGAGSHDTGILEKRGEIKRLRTKASELEGEAAGAALRLSDISAAIEAAEAHLESKRSSLHAVDIEAVNIEAEFKRYSEETVRLKAALDERDAAVKEAVSAHSRLSGKSATLSSERQGLEKELNERDARIASITASVSALSAGKERLAHLITELKIALAQTEERANSIRKESSGKEAHIIELDGRLSVRSRELASGNGEVSLRLKEIEESRARVERFLSQANAIKKEQAAKADEISALNERLSSVDEELKALKSMAAGIQESKARFSLELQEKELKLGHLKERTAEKYGVEVSALAYEEDASSGQGVLEAERQDLKDKITSLGEVSLSALDEYNDLEGRRRFLETQQEDLSRSVEALHNAILRINRTTRERFRNSFDEINETFKTTFPRFFSGGRAELRLTDEADMLECGIEIVAQPPGKRLQNITLLSGGEKALTAISLIFAIFLIKPSPFCLLDEVDAPLDDANIDRFNSFVKEMSNISQFLMITHNKRTMEMADTLYGITMEEPGISKIISVKF
ncbi:MAG: chromosome segregation protein SMC [Deltaproteobacteria bacterium]|nr:chromosome segregation protein SMC [Deltaproteobacteria bacterium]